MHYRQLRRGERIGVQLVGREKVWKECVASATTEAMKSVTGAVFHFGACRFFQLNSSGEPSTEFRPMAVEVVPEKRTGRTAAGVTCGDEVTERTVTGTDDRTEDEAMGTRSDHAAFYEHLRHVIERGGWASFAAAHRAAAGTYDGPGKPPHVTSARTYCERNNIPVPKMNPAERARVASAAKMKRRTGSEGRKEAGGSARAAEQEGCGNEAPPARNRPVEETKKEAEAGEDVKTAAITIEHLVLGVFERALPGDCVRLVMELQRGQ